jgi:MFS superfamily sulfate permease-like transporter
LVIDFMSVPVNAGFTSAAAITIASSQVPGIFGLELRKRSGIVGFVGTWTDVFTNFDTIRAGTNVMIF